MRWRVTYDSNHIPFLFHASELAQNHASNTIILHDSLVQPFEPHLLYVKF